MAWEFVVVDCCDCAIVDAAYVAPMGVVSVVLLFPGSTSLVVPGVICCSER